MPNGYDSSYTGQHIDNYENRITALETSNNGYNTRIETLENEVLSHSTTQGVLTLLDRVDFIQGNLQQIKYADFTLSSITFTAGASGSYYKQITSADLGGVPQSVIDNMLFIKTISYSGSWRILDFEAYGNNICIYSQIGDTIATLKFRLFYY